MEMFNSNSVVGQIKLKRFLRYACSILLFYVLSVSLVEFNNSLCVPDTELSSQLYDTFHISDQTKMATVSATGQDQTPAEALPSTRKQVEGCEENSPDLNCLNLIRSPPPPQGWSSSASRRVLPPASRTSAPSPWTRWRCASRCRASWWQEEAVARSPGPSWAPWSVLSGERTTELTSQM